MLTTTWELHFAAPRSPEQEMQFTGDLGELKRQFTELRIDWFEDEDRWSVMVDSVEVFIQVLDRCRQHTLLEITCQFDGDDDVHGKLMLDDEEEERSEISFPMSKRSE
jgi:hypothetical protein